MRASIVYVWSSNDEKLFKSYRKAIYWMMVLIIVIYFLIITQSLLIRSSCHKLTQKLFGLVILVATICGFIEFKGCSQKVAPPTASLTVLIIFIILSILVISLACIGIFLLTKLTSGTFKQYLRTLIIFVILSVVVMLALWIYTCYMEYDWYRSRMLLAYLCNKEVADCWDEIQRSHSCCGWDSPKDWRAIPKSCCNPSLYEAEEFCKTNNTTWIPLELAFKEGCRSHMILRSLIYILVVTLAWVLLVVVTLFIVFFGIHLHRGLNIKEKLPPPEDI